MISIGRPGAAADIVVRTAAESPGSLPAPGCSKTALSAVKDPSDALFDLDQSGDSGFGCNRRLILTMLPQQEQEGRRGWRLLRWSRGKLSPNGETVRDHLVRRRPPSIIDGDRLRWQD